MDGMVIRSHAPAWRRVAAPGQRGDETPRQAESIGCQETVTPGLVPPVRLDVAVRVPPFASVTE